MSDEISISYKQKVLLYLKDHLGVEGQQELPEAVTQKGISEGVDMSRTHVSRIVKELKDNGFLNEKKSHVKGRNRKLKTYTLSQKGVSRTRELSSELGEKEMEIVKEGEKQKMKLKDIPGMTDEGLNILDIILRSESEEMIDLDSIGPKEPVQMLTDAVEVENLYARDRELRELKRWLKADEPFGILMGEKGHGSSTLASRFIDDIDGFHKIWIDLDHKAVGEIEEQLWDFIEEVGMEEQEELIDSLRDIHGLIVFDDYYDLPDAVVDFFKDMVEKTEPADEIKILVTTRKGMPVYERFYRPGQKGELVSEVEVPPLQKEQAKKILEEEVKEDSLDRIMMMTNGSPKFLKLLREEKRDKLERCSPLDKEQISLLLFLKDDTV